MFVGIVACLLVSPAWARNPDEAPHPEFEPRALQLLQQMAEAYAQLPALSQETIFYSAMTPLPPPNAPPGSAPPPTEEKEDRRQMRLLMERPNHLLMELRQFNPATNRVMLSQWVSDGKTFWTYTQERNGYTREKAPSRLRDFVRMPSLNSGSLELLMLLGVNPFADIKDRVDSARYEGTASVRGVPTEVVALRVASQVETTESRLYIGKSDLLLRRVVIETTPAAATRATGRIGDALDELLDDSPSAPPPPADPNAPDDPNALPPLPAPIKTRITYENILQEDPIFGPTTFHFTIPRGALLYRTLDQTNSLHTGSRKEYLRELIKSLKSQRGKR